MATVHVARSGGGIEVSVPSDLLEQLGLEEGSEAEAVVQEGALVIGPVSASHGYELEDLLNGITSENLHGEISTGRAIGNESW